jgi:hypothetical protein
MQTETKSQHTPGPWWRNIDARYPIFSQQRHQKVAQVLHGGRTGVTEAEALANCDLIAAAPELLDSLRNLVGLAGMRGSISEYRAALDDARAAIAKATGGK